MAGFWYPYADFGEAQRRLCGFADAAVGPSCGITFSDGVRLALVRRAQGPSAIYVNVLRHQVTMPILPPAKSRTRWQTFEHWIENGLTAIGEAQIQQSQAQLAASKALLGWAHDDIWLPAHEFLLRHKLVADSIGVGLDLIGVAAGIGLIIAAAPLVAGGAAAAAVVTAIGTTGLITGGMAAAGSLILLRIDGAVLLAEVHGDEAGVEKIENDPKFEWARIVATVMLLPDIAVGGPRALAELGKLGEEARVGATEARNAEAASIAQRERIMKIRRPQKHVGAVQRHAHRAKVLAREAQEHRTAVLRAQGKMALLVARDVNASYASSPGSAALLTGMPPKVLESSADIARDKRIADLLAPEHGMRDTKFEVRMTGVRRLHAQP